VRINYFLREEHRISKCLSNAGTFNEAYRIGFGTLIASFSFIIGLNVFDLTCFYRNRLFTVADIDSSLISNHVLDFGFGTFDVKFVPVGYVKPV
jgi:hypothetical protein